MALFLLHSEALWGRVHLQLLRLAGVGATYLYLVLMLLGVLSLSGWFELGLLHTVSAVHHGSSSRFALVPVVFLICPLMSRFLGEGLQA